MSAGAVIALHRKRLVRKFREAGATHPSRAVAMEFLGERPNWIFRRMVSAGVFLPTGDGLYYMDEPAATEFLRRKRKRALTLAAASLLVFLLVWAVALLFRN